MRYIRNVSPPHCAMYSSGTTTLPLDFDIFAPSLTIVPWARNRVNGSVNSRYPKSCSAIVIKREYMRCSTACSLPPMYEFTGSHLADTARSNARSLNSVEGYRKKYHDESRNVSDTSVSRRASLPHLGHGTRYHSSSRASGDTPLSSGRKSSVSGSSTGRFSSGTGTVPQSSQ